jgi:hypothetical protein
MHYRIKHCLSALALVAGCAAQAQSGASLVALPEASSAECLTLVAGAHPPVYPEGELALKREAVVRVRLVFAGGDAAPKASVFHNLGPEAMSNAVLEYVRNYRLPCMAAGAEPVIATQEFHFTLEGRKIVYGGLRDELARKSVIACVTGDERRPEYPRDLKGPLPQGNVIVRLKFSNASEPPTATILTDAGSRVLRRVVLDHVERYRMPCLPATAKPIEAMRTFSFRQEGARQYTLNDLTLQQFVDGLDKLEQQRVRFDFSGMSCPFDVRVNLYQPYAKNSVGEIDRIDPNRREFIEWLRGVALKLPEAAAPQLIGQSMTVSVPCGMLDLT